MEIDRTQERTTLARDPFGAVPLYYCVFPDGRVEAGDRVRDLLARGVPRRLSRAGLRSYLAYGCVSSPLTMIEGVRTVRAGHTVTVANGRVAEARTWRPDFTPRIGSRAAAQEQVTRAVREALGAQIEANGGVAPAAFLSGGIDSGAIVAVLRQLTDGEIRTYCVRHDDDRTEESAWAQKVAEANGTKHTVLRISDRMMRENILAAVSSYDQPTFDGLNFWFASKLVSEAGERTVLSGEGGDELFAGYGRFAKHVLAYRWAARLRRTGSAAWGRALGPLVRALAPNERIRKLGALMDWPGDPYPLPRRIFGDAQIDELLRPDLRADAGSCGCAALEEEAPPVSDLINRISWLELQTVTTDAWLRDGYQTSAPFGLKVRTPLLDVKLAELLFAIPGALKCCPEYQKPLLVGAAGKGLPMACVTRPKMGFSLPFQRYFTGELKDMIDAFLSGEGLMLFDGAAVRRLGARYRAGRVSWSRVWTLFVAEHWCRTNGVKIE